MQNKKKLRSKKKKTQNDASSLQTQEVAGIETNEEPEQVLEEELNNEMTETILQAPEQVLEEQLNNTIPETINEEEETPIMEIVSSEKDSGKKKRIKGRIIQRSEASLNISEFNLTEVGKEKIKLNELIKTSQKMSGQVSVNKQLETAKKLKSLSIPLSKPQQEKIKRTVAYEKTCEEVSKWDKVVRSNRSAEQIIFPLNKPEIHLQSFESVAENFVSKHPVEIAVEKLLKKSDNALDQKRPLTVAEEKALQAMSLEEAKLRHGELMKHRALISYQEAKARRQNKIKSKRYHRILRKERLKKLMTEFEQLEKVDAVAALEKVMEVDKIRVLERMTLKHRNTGKWAKMNKLRAKYNPEARNNLKEDLNLGKQLKEKLPTVQNAIRKLDVTLEDPDIAAPEAECLFPDMEMSHVSCGNIETPGGHGTCLTEDLEINSDPQNLAFSLEEHLKKGFKKRTKSASAKPPKVSERDIEFADMDFISKTKTLNSCNPSTVTIGDGLDDEEEEDGDEDDVDEGVKNVSEAFADEDIIAEFREEKVVTEKANRPKGIDLYLPGWGSWGGHGVKESKKKRKRFFIKPLEVPKPKKSTLGNVIINEEEAKKAAVHQVSEVPFPFSNVKQFESYIRQPIGHTWNAEASFRNLISPRIVTKAGKIIAPIDDIILDKKNTKTIKLKNKKQKNKLQQAF